jgi:hypothetical protein
MVTVLVKPPKARGHPGPWLSVRTPLLSGYGWYPRAALDVDYRQFYDLESYLLNVVGQQFREDGRLGVFDFFCIVCSKART